MREKRQIDTSTNTQQTRNYVVYVGYFVAPDGNAGGIRVWNIAKMLMSAGRRIVFYQPFFRGNLSVQKNPEQFICYHYSNVFEKIMAKLFCPKLIHFLINNHSKIETVIFYNYSSLLTLLLNSLCHCFGITTISDITEWGDERGLRGLDTKIRMHFANHCVDGLIVISPFLNHFYGHKRYVFELPPLVNIQNEQNPAAKSVDDRRFKLVFFGTISKEKERLDILVSAVEKTDNAVLYIIGVTLPEFQNVYGFVPNKIDKIVFLGEQSHEDTLSFVARCNCFALLREKNRITEAGFSTKIAEAFSIGIPVIALKDSQYSSFITEGQNGYLISKLDESTVIETIVKAQSERLPFAPSSAFSISSHQKSFLSWYQMLLGLDEKE